MQSKNYTDSIRRLEKYWLEELNGVSLKDASLNGKDTYWWLCDKGHKSKQAVRAREKGACAFCSGRLPIKGETDFKTTHPKIANAWNYELNKKRPEDYKSGAKAYVYWVCPEGHSYKNAIYLEVRYNNYCKECAKLAFKRPDLKEMWSPKNKKAFEDYSYRHQEKVWWECSKGHTFKRAIFHQTSRVLKPCPQCSYPLENSAKSLPFISMWNDSKDPIYFAPNSNKVVNWRCDAGHEFSDSIKKMNYRYGTCPECSNKESYCERAIKNFVSEQGVVIRENLRLLDGKEIDILVPKLGIGFEVNGELWHSNELIASKGYKGTAEAYHLEKVEKARVKGIELFFVWSHDMKKHKEVFEEILSVLRGSDRSSLLFLNRVNSTQDVPCVHC